MVAACAREGRRRISGAAQTSRVYALLIFFQASSHALWKSPARLPARRIEGKILVDLSNPLDFSQGMPPSLAFCNTESLGERIQAAYPAAKVVKALNTINVAVMVAPQDLPEETDLFIAGNDAEAKKWVTDELLKSWLGWKRVHDLGGISNARGTEMYLPLWVRLWGATGTGVMNIRVVTAAS